MAKVAKLVEEINRRPQPRTFPKRDAEVLLTEAGFTPTGGKGSHQKWSKPGYAPLVLSLHGSKLDDASVKALRDKLEEVGFTGRE